LENWDLIVAGSGPAGSIAAAEAAQAGMKTLILEKRTLPRHKTCGGGVPVALRAIAPDIDPCAIAEKQVRFMQHTWQFGTPVLAPVASEDAADDSLTLWMVQRSVFDHYLATRAVRFGAELRDGMTVRSVEVSKEGVTVHAQTNGGAISHLHSDFVIGADGANGIIAKCAGLQFKRDIAMAMEAEVPWEYQEGDPILRADAIHLEYGAVPYGYAWIFPKATHLNVGAGIFLPQAQKRICGETLRETLLKAMREYLVSVDVKVDWDNQRIYAHPLPLWSGKHRLNTLDGRILLAGDAAALVNPLFGDGILHAARSGKIAAECLVTGDGENYTNVINSQFADNFDAARKLAKFFYQWTGLVYKYGISRPSATHTAARLLCGEALFTDVAGKAMRRIRAAMRK
jgi:geranylgeranyl reductase family protein